jgi:hypothetical protein
MVAGQPVISVDTKKKEKVGRFRNGGREYQPKGSPEPVNTHDFKDPELGKVIPHGVYDPVAHAGWVSLGIDHDTAEFAVESLRRRWRTMGSQAYPQAQQFAHHRRLQGEQRIPHPGLEARGVPLPAGHEQVEQDRASALLQTLRRLNKGRPTRGRPGAPLRPGWTVARPAGPPPCADAHMFPRPRPTSPDSKRNTASPRTLARSAR